MALGSMAWHVANGISLAALIVCLLLWGFHGYRFPRWVHVLAVGLLLAGVVALVAASAFGILSLRLAASCLLIPPAFAYVGWLWLFGPLWRH